MLLNIGGKGTERFTLEAAKIGILSGQVSALLSTDQKSQTQCEPLLSLLFLLFDVSEPYEGIYLVYRRECHCVPELGDQPSGVRWSVQTEKTYKYLLLSPTPRKSLFSFFGLKKIC